MSSFLQRLENNEAVLVMYLFDELPAEDRAEVEQMLATDAGLRAELERLREAHAQTEAGLRKLDASQRLPVPEAVAIRQVARLIDQWSVDRLADRAGEAAPATRRRLAAWIGYPAGAVAAGVVVALLWWGLSENTGNTTALDDNAPFPGFSMDSIEGSGHESLMQSITNDAFVRDVVRDSQLQQVESQMIALWQASADDPFIVPIEVER